MPAKIGAMPAGGSLDRDTQVERERTEARARVIRERQAFDTVGLLLSGGGGGGEHDRPAREEMDATLHGGEAMTAGLIGGECESAAGRFLYRARDAGTRYEVEAQLPGGRLTKVLRNPMRRTLTFEGEVVSHWALGHQQDGRRAPSSPIAARAPESEHFQERLVIRIPQGFDLAGPPAHVERAFADGRCLVALHRRSGAAGAGPGVAWQDGEL